MKNLMSLLVPAVLLAGDIDVLPTPHYVEPLEKSVRIAGDVPIRVRLGQPYLRAAMDALAEGFPEARFADEKSNAQVILWDYSTAHNPEIALNFLDRYQLTESPLHAQSYILRTDAHSVWVVGGGPVGVLYGAATLAQLFQKTGAGIEVPGVYIRDYPDFEFRAASDWLLSAEVNRWALDRGHGLADYGRLVRKKINRAARYKINVALIDGFGWSFDKRPAGYSPLMLELNRYARQRGVLLQYGGYGAAYDIAQREGEYFGKVFLNRDSYPDGRVYRCMAYPERKGGIDPRTMGSCRSNEELNGLKAEELAHFVDAVEPGMLYIHHEDCCVFEDLQKAWLGRCERCRRRWPNDSLLSAEGGAGALAHGYSNLVEAVNRVRHSDSGYEAARDTQITLVSPVYMPATERSEDWGHVLELWRIVARLLPRAQNVQICFREILPQKGGGKSWVELFNSVMNAEKQPFRAYVFVVGGADNFLTDYPTTGIPAMNAYFESARTIFNATGDSYREPLEVLAAEYSWNTRSTGFFRSPANEAEMAGIDRWIYKPANPPELFGPGKIFDRICAHLYGAAAGVRMSEYYRDAEWIPDIDSPPNPPDRAFYRGRRSAYLPGIWNYATALPSYWNYLAMDARTWGTEPDERYRSGRNGFSATTVEIHRRLAHRWSLAADLNVRGAAQVREALAAGPKADALEDLEFLRALFQVYQPLIESLRDYHAVRSHPGGTDTADLIQAALKNAQTADALAIQYFPEPADPAMGEVRSLRAFPRQLSDAIASWEKSK